MCRSAKRANRVHKVRLFAVGADVNGDGRPLVRRVDSTNCTKILGPVGHSELRLDTIRYG